MAALSCLVKLIHGSDILQFQRGGRSRESHIAIRFGVGSRLSDAEK